MPEKSINAQQAQACAKTVCDLHRNDVFNVLSNGLSYPLDKWEQDFKRFAAEYEKLDKPQKVAIRVAVVGAYSAGKSCFINSILGENFAPEAITPTTQGITRFVYGKTKNIYDGEKQISYEEYVHLIQQEGNKEFRVTYPCPFLRNKELLDTVGLFEPKKAQAHWQIPEKDKELIRQADVLLYITEGGNATLKKEEEDFLCEILDPSAEKVPLLYIILNKMDVLKESDRKLLQQYTEKFCDEQNFKLEKFMTYCSLLTKTRPDCVQARERVRKVLDEVEDRYAYVMQHVTATKKAQLDREFKKCCNNIKKQLPSNTQIANVFSNMSAEKRKEKELWSEGLQKMVEDIAAACLHNRHLVRSRKSVEEKDGTEGGGVGMVGGAAAGFMVGGPLGAIVGGILGAGVGEAVTAQEEKFEITIAPVFENWKTHFNKFDFPSKKAKKLAREVCEYAFDTEQLDSKLTEDFDLYLDKTAEERDSLKITIADKALLYIRAWAKKKINPAAAILAADTIAESKKVLQKAQTELDKFKELLDK